MSFISILPFSAITNRNLQLAYTELPEDKMNLVKQKQGKANHFSDSLASIMNNYIKKKKSHLAHIQVNS